MTTPLIPQEIYLLERYSSAAYFGELRDHFATLVRAAEEALDHFMRHLPPDYRSRALNEQPDAVWGERIIPNLQWTLEALETGYIQMTGADWDAMGLAGNVKGAFAAINRDYSSDWMPKPFEEVFDAEWRKSSRLASNIFISQQGGWEMDSLTARYKDENRGPLNAPSTWPLYRLNHTVRVKTDEKVPQNGIYLPDANASSAQVMIEGYKANEAIITLLNEPRYQNGEYKDALKPTTWTLVERIAETGGGTPGDPDPVKAGVRLRAMAGEVCPRTGHWFTPARANSRSRFEAGQTMPDAGGTWGTTIWQWDEQQ